MVFSLTKLFPHFHRINPARLLSSLEIVLLWGGLLAVITLNVFALGSSRPAYWNELMKLFSSPFSVSRHMDLATILWRQGQKPEARALISSAQLLSVNTQAGAQGNTANVLGSVTSPTDTLIGWEHDAEELERQYAFWQTVAVAKPDYRDAFVTLAFLSYQLGKHDTANNWIAQALVLDPNHSPSQSFSRFLQGK